MASSVGVGSGSRGPLPLLGFNFSGHTKSCASFLPRGFQPLPCCCTSDSNSSEETTPSRNNASFGRREALLSMVAGLSASTSGSALEDVQGLRKQAREIQRAVEEKINTTALSNWADEEGEKRIGRLWQKLAVQDRAGLFHVKYERLAFDKMAMRRFRDWETV